MEKNEEIRVIYVVRETSDWSFVISGLEHDNIVVKA